MEHGATRNFQAEKLIEEEEKRITQEREEEELNNPMKVGVVNGMYLLSWFNWQQEWRVDEFSILYQVLENRTKDSKMEMEVLENLQELKELNQRQAQVDFEGMIDRYRELERQEKEREKEEDERETKWVRKVYKDKGLKPFISAHVWMFYVLCIVLIVSKIWMRHLFFREMLDRALVKRLRDSDSDSGSEKEEESLQPNKSSTDKPTDILTTDRSTEAQVHTTTHIKH